MLQYIVEAGTSPKCKVQYMYIYMLIPFANKFI